MRAFFQFRGWLGALLLACAGGGLFCGCATSVQPRLARCEWSHAKAHPQRVAIKTFLVLEPELTGYSHVWQRGASSYTYVLGAALTTYATETAKAFFENVVVARANGLPNASPADLVLTPELRRFALSRPYDEGGRQQIFIQVRWSLRRYGSSVPLWAGSVEGCGQDAFASATAIEHTLNSLWQDSLVQFGSLQQLAGLTQRP